LYSVVKQRLLQQQKMLLYAVRLATKFSAMDSRLFVLAHQEARRQAQQFMAAAPDGWRIECKPPRRNSAINAALHAMLGRIAARVPWAGKLRGIETWKRLLVAAWCRAQNDGVEILPALDGQGVDIVFRPTSKMTQDEMRDLLGYIEAWAAEQPEIQEDEE
jgi:hypothetical protein